MHPLALAIGYAWIVFWIYWLVRPASRASGAGGGPADG